LLLPDMPLAFQSSYRITRPLLLKIVKRVWASQIQRHRMYEMLGMVR
jgi:hypothetical protein